MFTRTLALALIAVAAASPADDLQPSFDFRWRLESRRDADFRASIADVRTDLFSRYRVGLDWKKDVYAAKVQYQYAHDWVWSTARNFSTENSDLSEAWASAETSAGKVKVGRQKIALADERLIGPLEWHNLGRSMDGLRFGNKQWDATIFKFGISPRISYDAVVGYASYALPNGQAAYIYKSDREPAGDVRVHTLNVTDKRKLGKFQTEAEAAVQFGQTAGKDLEAFALHLGASTALSPKFNLYLEGNVASGGSSNRTVRTFDNLYPTNHKFYGNMDLQGWRNMWNVALLGTYQIDAKTSARAAFHGFWLYDAKDGWYGASGPINARSGGRFIDPTGQSGTSVGTELDLEVRGTLGRDFTASAGFSLFFPGSFIKNMNSGEADNQAWWFLVIGKKF